MISTIRLTLPDTNSAPRVSGDNPNEPCCNALIDRKEYCILNKLFIILLGILVLSACSAGAQPKSNAAEASIADAAEQVNIESKPEPVNSVPESAPESESLVREDEPESVPEPYPISGEDEQEISSPADHVGPQILILRGVDSIVKLNEILRRSDSEIEAYLRETNLYMNGLESKKDIEALFHKLGSLYFPVTEGGQFSAITVYEGRDTVDVFYELPDAVRCVFNLSTEPSSAKRIIEANESGDMEMKDLREILSEAVKFPEGIKVYASAKKSGSDDIQYFDMDIQGEYTKARVFNANDLTAAAKVLQAFDFVKLDFSSASGVSAVSALSDESTAASQQTGQDTSATMQPANSIHFDGYDEIAELYDMLEWSDTEIEEQARINELYAFRTRDAISSFLETIHPLYFPQIEDKEPSQIAVYPERKYMYISYGADGRATYYFGLLMEPDSAGGTISGLQADGVTLEDVTADLALPEGITAFAHIRNAEDAANENISRETFYFNVHGYYFDIDVVDAASLSDAIERLQEIDFVRFDSIGE